MATAVSSCAATTCGFDVNPLAALRMEDPAVFDPVHRFVFSLVGRKLSHTTWQGRAEYGPMLAVVSRMSAPTRPQLGRLIVTPFATIGVLAAVLVWEVEHVGSIALALLIAAVGVLIGVIVARQLRADIESVAESKTCSTCRGSSRASSR